MSRINKENAVRNVYRVWMIGMLLILMVLAFAGCGQAPAQGTAEAPSGGKLQIVATTTMLADLARELGGDQVEVSALMEAGIDPHLYKASAGDVETMQKADLVVYNGLHLEGKMEEVFENLEKMGKSVVMIASNLSEDQLLKDEESGGHDPHIWFDVKIWKAAAVNLRDGLIARDAANTDFYKERYDQYAVKLDELDAYIHEQIKSIPEASRVLITAHDAFGYFGHAYGIEVRGLQGISTASEAGTGDVKELADFIVERKIRAIFIESSVPKRSVEALQEAVRAKGFQVEIGGELYSDSLGSPGTDAESYIGTVKSNVDLIVRALKQE